MILFNYRNRLQRVITHIVFWLMYIVFFSITSLNPKLTFSQTLINGFIFVPVDIFATYVTIYWLLPAFLIKKKYLFFAGLIILLAFSTVLLNQIIQYYIYIPIFHPEYAGIKIFWQGNYWFYLVTTNAVVVLAAGIKLTKLWVHEQQDKNELENQKIKSELLMLKSQFNPHFLFNTLNNIDSLIETNPQKASKSIIMLSEILRYATYTSSFDFVSIEKEEECLRSFIELNYLRFGDDFINYEAEINNHNILIAPMLLVPLVENAVKHGDKKSKPPAVNIRLKVEEHIEFSVSNALPQNDIQKDHAGGVGIINLRRRLELLYPNRHRFENKISENTYTAYLWIQ